MLRWESVHVDASDCLSVADLSRKIGASLEALLSTDPHVPRAVRVTVTGKSPAHGLFFGRATQLRAEVLNQIGIIGNDRLWLEKVKLETRAADMAAAQNEQFEALADLKRCPHDVRNDVPAVGDPKDREGALRDNQSIGADRPV